MGMTYECFRVERRDRVAHVVMCRPEKRNSMIAAFWSELPQIIESLDQEGTVRAVVLSAEGPHFTGGMDLSVFAGMGASSNDAQGRIQKPVAFLNLVRTLQNSFSCLEACRMPVLAAIQGGCIGGGVDLATACDMRYATKDAYLTIHETNIGMTADVGTFPRLLNLIPEGFVRELAYTGRRIGAEEAHTIGLVNKVFETQEAMLDHVLGLAQEIAKKAPLAVYGCKKMITHARDHSTADALDYVGLWNASMLHAEQIMEAMTANMEKREGAFVDLPPIRMPFDQK
ncbi:MAG: crotonase/enoyl-CoA hydratase family protein [Myxococcota bacterium]